MSIFTQEDPITVEYLERKGFERYPEPCTMTDIYEKKFKNENGYIAWYSTSPAILRFYFKAAKKSKLGKCELLYKGTRKTFHIPCTESDMDEIIYECQKLTGLS